MTRLCHFTPVPCKKKQENVSFPFIRYISSGIHFEHVYGEASSHVCDHTHSLGDQRESCTAIVLGSISLSLRLSLFLSAESMCVN